MEKGACFPSSPEGPVDRSAGRLGRCNRGSQRIDLCIEHGEVVRFDRLDIAFVAAKFDEDVSYVREVLPETDPGLDLGCASSVFVVSRGRIQYSDSRLIVFDHVRMQRSQSGRGLL